MQNTKTQDTLVGVFVACSIVALFFMAMQISNLSSFSQDGAYTIIARFENSGGLKVRSPVSVAGVRIGRVANISIDKESYESIVAMDIDAQYNLPDDTSASIFTAGLLGEQYVSLEPGGSEEFIEANGSIDITQSAIVLEEIIGQFLFNDAAEE
ncbi:MAG: outer membrane lipid asymmetry maintenance protein MlaD [Methylococcales bacterium]|nr:outer membrane lipid asymmetry maintenance protein MlaD [Methylococcales bacterium]